MNEMNYTIIEGPVTLATGEILTEADIERMADEAEAFEPDYDAIFARARAKGGRPSLGVGESPISHVRFDEATRQRLAQAAEAEHTTTSAIIRTAVDAWLSRPHAVGE